MLSQRLQKRAYAVAAEDTNKGVVSCYTPPSLLRHDC